MRILLAEDDAVLTSHLQRILHREHFAVDVAASGVDALHMGYDEAYNCVVLDLGLPLLDGVSVLRGWRDAGRSFPVLMLTARNAWSDKAAAFKAGADDYLTKPFLPDELVARIRALLRRANGGNTAPIRCGALSYEMQTGGFWLGEQPLSLTAFESRLLTALIMRKEATVERSRLLDSIYEAAADIPAGTMEVLIGRLRRKIGTEMIQTVRGQGYRLTAKLS
ncbi:response regulator [Novosphingobium terrae]|uniref:response regulator n=1 Tax=Novosphingobium terrae TaxID=2726189 RepID=UPI00197DF35B|nr:response regulator transcription factor [Novosphingobium terrae]